MSDCPCGIARVDCEYHKPPSQAPLVGRAIAEDMGHVTTYSYIQDEHTKVISAPANFNPNDILDAAFTAPHSVLSSLKRVLDMPPSQPGTYTAVEFNHGPGNRSTYLAVCCPLGSDVNIVWRNWVAP